jgi:hypothetical protein
MFNQKKNHVEFELIWIDRTDNHLIYCYTEQAIIKLTNTEQGTIKLTVTLNKLSLN